jgi:MYXO-CTERM domain-containing protein
MRKLGRRVVTAAVSALALLTGTPASAAVTEPNGVVVPVLEPPRAASEMSLLEYFTDPAVNEPIDPIAEANAQPGVFSPLCEFQATLVLSEGGSRAGISWYNPPADPTAAPAEVYELIPEPSTLGETITSAGIRNDPNWAGGPVGFVLIKNGARIYYSEYQRNVFCSGCDSPGHWVMALAYRSKVEANTYYLAFEEWEDADETDWQGNDGDFNDKVFKITGVNCLGGGEPCDTGKLAHCAQGLTECQPGGTLACVQQIPEAGEACDNIDNDCNGEVDDGDLCDPGLVCVRGTCVDACGAGEFVCNGGLECDEGFCVDPECVGMRCDAGLVCRAGECVDPCTGVSCPLGQTCQLGHCVDPCAGVECAEGNACERGVCVASCRGCPSTGLPEDEGRVCSLMDGRCVNPGCESMTCAPGTVCSGGSCVDACTTETACPGGAVCMNGVCGEPDPTLPPGNPGSGGMGGLNFGTGGGIDFGGTANPNGGNTQRNGLDRSGTEGGCACRAGQGTTRGWGALVLGLIGALIARRRAQLRSAG